MNPNILKKTCLLIGALLVLCNLVISNEVSAAYEGPVAEKASGYGAPGIYQVSSKTVYNSNGYHGGIIL